VLGERPLYLTSPHLRGDDVAELQTRLGRLGFDCGRVDGIFGRDTLRALEEFQRNTGVAVDGICGRASVRTLHALGRHSGDGPGVATLREQEQLRAGVRRLDRLRVVTGQFGGLGAIARNLVRELRLRGAFVLAVDDPAARGQAESANRFDADVYLGFEAQPEPGGTIAYYAVPTFESAGGRSLALHLSHALTGDRAVTSFVGPEGIAVVGLRLPILRETRMPAVLVTIGPVRPAVDAASTIATAVITALLGWAEDPLHAPVDE
jgi:N-acetylmuramoyl-L-alanine amidase